MKPENCKVEYLGISKPKSPDEILFEISGLEHLICKANERIASLKQSKLLAEITIKEIVRTEEVKKSV